MAQTSTKLSASKNPQRPIKFVF